MSGARDPKYENRISCCKNSIFILGQWRINLNPNRPKRRFLYRKGKSSLSWWGLERPSSCIIGLWQRGDLNNRRREFTNGLGTGTFYNRGSW